MSVIINGFNMPDTCEKCLFARWSNVNQTSSCALVPPGKKCFEMYSVEYRSKRSDICPLTPVHPEPLTIEISGNIPKDEIIDRIIDELGKRKPSGIGYMRMKGTE